MRAHVFLAGAACIQAAAGAINWTLERSSSPSDDEIDAYDRITAAMDAAVARHSRLDFLSKDVTVAYTPGVPTAEANYDGLISFGENRAYMTERTALHEIGHTLGVGQRQAFDDHCAAGDWPSANPLLRTFDGDGASIQCGGGHFWPYGLNYEDEFSDEAADRHCRLLQAMVDDGMQAY